MQDTGRRPSIDTRLSEAVGLVKAGKCGEARDVLVALLKADPCNDTAWLWMAAAVESDEMRAECLREALKYAPDNKAARQALEKHERSSLGKCLGEYKGKGVLGPVLMFILSLSGAFIIPRFLPLGTSSSLTTGIRILGVLFALGALIDIATVLPGHHMAAYENGIRYTKWGHTKTVQWEDITHVWQSYLVGRSGRHIRYTLKIRGETKRLSLTAEQLKDLDAIGKMIQQQVTRHLLPGYAETLNSGGSVQFGPLALDRSGMSIGRQTIPWDGIEGVDIHRGMIVIQQQGQWLARPRISAMQIPNLYAFLSLANQLVGHKQSRY